MTVESDFSSRKRFPGETGNPLDTILHAFNAIERIPFPFFALLLLGLAIIFTFARWQFTFVLFFFFLFDWMALALLPRAMKSFGPSKPPTLILAGMRSLVALLPFIISFPLQFLGVLLVIYGFWIEPHYIQVTYQKLSTPKFRPVRPIRLLHLGDLHIERITTRERQLNRLINDLKPDLILFSGDILNLSFRQEPQAMEEARSILSGWAAPLGVFIVSGSPAVDLVDIFPKIILDLPLHWLDDERVTINFLGDAIDVIGLTCTHRPHEDGRRLNALIDTTLDHFTILLYHTPDLAPIASRSNIDLQLSGHTHGGQIRLPWFGALLTGSLYGKKFEAGRIPVGNLLLYVTRGLGMEGAGAPRVRFLCPPEIILWEIG